MSFDVNRPDAILRLMVVRSVRVHMAAILLSLLPIPAATVHAREAALGEQLPAMTLRGLNGPALSLASLRGRPLLINVWASWCEPCREEMTSLERLAWRNGGRDFAIIGISTDDDAQQALTLLRNTHATISHFISAGGWSGTGAGPHLWRAAMGQSVGTSVTSRHLHPAQTAQGWPARPPLAGTVYPVTPESGAPQSGR